MTDQKRVKAEEVSLLFRKKGLTETPKWVDFSLSSRMPDLWQNLKDTIQALRLEMASYKREYYDNPTFKRKCFDLILYLIWNGMAAGSEKFHKLTKDLIPLMQRNIETSKKIEEIVSFVQNLKGKQRFYMLCFCYLVVYEGNFKSILKTLLALKRLVEGKNVNISRFLKVMTDEKLERSMDEVTPDDLKRGIHRHLRNAVAHVYFTYLEDEDKMQFWDIFPNKDKHSMKPVELDYREFSRYLVEVNIFCEIYGFLVLLFIAFEDIAKRQRR